MDFKDNLKIYLVTEIRTFFLILISLKKSAILTEIV